MRLFLKLPAQSGDPEPQSSGAMIALVQNMLKDVVNNGMSLEDAFESFYTQAEVEFQMAQA